jgi:paraquat-inducible protein B
MTEAHAASVSQKRAINPIWFVPVIALLLGAWMVFYTLSSEGPEITLVLSTAEGIEAGKTKIKLRSVDIGLVETVELREDLESVRVVASLVKGVEELLREDTQFWVVRPRIGKSGVSGLSTLLSGGYIQLAPGKGAVGRHEFVGLEDPPVTPAGTPGVRVTLTAERAGSVSTGDPVLFRGYTVGRIESEVFDTDTKRMSYSVFIDAPYDALLTKSHRFWDTSGVSVRAGADGVEFDSMALETLLIGGVEVGRPEGIGMGEPVESGEVFRLYESYASVNERPYRHAIEYVVQFSRSVRGLKPGAPVEYRGIRIGQVERVMLTELSHRLEGRGTEIPVLIRLEPARLEQADSPAGVEFLREAVARAVSNGLRASLSTGNLLTGSLYVALDLYPELDPVEIGTYADLPTLPTIVTGLEGIEHQVSTFLAKLNALPLEATVSEATHALSSIDRLVAGPSMQDLPTSLDGTLRELRATLGSLSADSELQGRLLPMITELDRTLLSLRQMLDTLEQQPNALIFNRKYRDDPRPPAGSQ